MNINIGDVYINKYTEKKYRIEKFLSGLNVEVINIKNGKKENFHQSNIKSAFKKV